MGLSDQVGLLLSQAAALSATTCVTRVLVRKEVDARRNKRAGSNSQHVGLRTQVACGLIEHKVGRLTYS